MSKRKEAPGAFLAAALILGVMLCFVSAYASPVFPVIGFAVILILIGRLVYLSRKDRANSRRVAEKMRVNAPELRRTMAAEDFRMLIDALAAMSTGEAPSIALFQRKLGLTRTKAGRVIDALEVTGFVGPRIGSRPRELLLDRGHLAIILDALRAEDARAR
jgi:predicted signal transduction protein with EAL and GGDEF domain